MKTCHLTDLQIDRLRCSPPGARHVAFDLAHLNGCSLCRERLHQLDAAAESVRTDLLTALGRAEESIQNRTSSWKPALIGLALATVLGVLMTLVLFPSQQDEYEHRVRTKGSPRLELVTNAMEGQTGQVVAGQPLRVRLSGMPLPRALVLQDTDGSFRLLWPLPGDTRAGPGDIVEVELKTHPPAGRLGFTGLFGPAPLPADQAETLARELEKNTRTRLPKGFRSVRRSIRITLR